MADLIPYLQMVNGIFWGDDVFHWWYYISVTIILILEKRKMVKRVYGFYPICFLLALFNPITYKIIQKLELGWPYFARLYSMLPLPVVLAVGIILLTEIICSISRKNLFHKSAETTIEPQEARWAPVVKLNMTVGICLLIVMGGTDVYQQDWMQPALNLEKIPNAVIEINEKLVGQEEICIAVPESLSSYIRQYAPSLYTPYGRFVNALGSALSKENPDPTYVMEEAGARSCNYIVIYDNQTNIEIFSNLGYEPYDRVAGYLIYSVEGVSYTKKMHNEKHQVLSEMYMDANDVPIVNKQGYAGKAYEYDNLGNRKKEIFLGYDGNRITLSQGYAAIEREYTRYSDKVQSIKYLDINDHPVMINGCYETRFSYNSARKPEREAYFDECGLPMNRVDLLYASKTIEYDKDGYVVSEHYYDISGKPKLSTQGFASYTSTLSENKTIIAEKYFDENGELLGDVYEGKTDYEGNVFQFLRCSSGISISEDRKYTFCTTYPENQFNRVCFQIYDMNNSHLGNFGVANETGESTGSYVFKFPKGIYKFILKANGIRRGENISFFIYIEEGTVLEYRFNIDVFEETKIVLSNVYIEMNK